MPGILADLSVAVRLAARATARRLRSQLEAPPALDGFQQGLQSLLDGAPPGLLKDHAWLDMPADRPPWVDSGVAVEEGDEVSYFVAGRCYASRALDIYVEPQQQVWCRVGDAGQLFRGTRAGHSFRAPSAGNVTFGNFFPNAWKSPAGARIFDDKVYKDNAGDFRILVIRWAGSAKEGIRGLMTAPTDSPLADELARIEQGDTTPAGWHYLWHIGPAEIFRDGQLQGGSACIHCKTHRDVGILQKDLDLPLTPDTELSWRWCVNRLPSTLREDSVPSHDYLSIAVEFDNGRDITYYWSAALPEGYGYDCPLPSWQGIEYHVVVRSGTEGLGEWLAEKRNLYTDYQNYMGEPPARITRIWFIANSIFQRGHGECDYADIHVLSPQADLQLL
jgi:hypothetical protein